MARLKLVGVALALMVATPARADPVAEWRSHIAEASARFGVPEDWIERVMRAESGGRPVYRVSPITSRAGAMGLMQLMPGTWKDMRSRLSLGKNPHHPRDNILAGTFYLRRMYERFGYPGMFAAYNAGPGRYAAYLAGRSRLPGETVAYLRKVTGERAPTARPLPERSTPGPDEASPGRDRPAAQRGIDDIFFINRPRP